MLRGELAGLRAREDDDIAILDVELHDDVLTRVRADYRPWRPVPPGSAASDYRVTGDREDMARFSVVEPESGELAGEALLWGIDLHNRTAHVGLSLRPAFRGRGLGTDTVRVLCRYGFAILGLHRLQIDTLADNDAMIAVAARAGFATEGTLRGAAWADGEFVNEVIMGQLASEWERS